MLTNLPPRLAGCAIPVFALRTRHSCGCGQFTDLIPFADWANSAGLRLIQLLPINDTSATMTWIDSYPYAGISVFALHPLYLDLTPLQESFTPAERKRLLSLQIQLNALPHMDYERTLAVKWEYAQLAYIRDRSKILGSADYQQFFKRSQSWLVPYAVFCYLRSKYGTADFSQWKEYSVYSEELCDVFANSSYSDYDKVEIHFYIQYLLHEQLSRAAAHCRALGIILKGDLPIGISRHSADAWTSPQYFNMDKQAGAPPDAFSELGQNWGFPTYNWDEMSRDNYTWWRKRLTAMSAYFDAYRVDHILGFFRIWEIPMHASHGLLGQFAPAMPLSISEITAQGAWFDAERLCQPYIRSSVLRELFPQTMSAVKEKYFEEYRSECYRFKENFNTQHKLLTYFQQHPECSTTLCNKLLSLCSDVVLVEDSRLPLHYHPRIAMHYTRSYCALDDAQKHALDLLYLDFYYRRHDAYWYAQAMQRLPALLAATTMLVCGEDLGMIPQCVPQVMRELGILGLVIGRMPAAQGAEFADISAAPAMSVASTGTHDMATLRQWWQEDRAATQRFYNNILHKDGAAPLECTTEIVRSIIEQYLHSPALLSVFPLQDLLAMDEELRHSDIGDERINVPSNPHNYWRYRMAVDVEVLRSAEGFSAMLRDMFLQSSRV